ncbi:hypothetical protein ACROYT_G028665 [Oculina patagonica]
MWNGNSDALATQACGSVVNNSLKSPGYPDLDYKRNMDCIYLVHIPDSMAMNISFKDFVIEDSQPYCDYDYLEIINDQNQAYGLYCGDMTGHTVLVTGNYAVIVFHSDEGDQEKGFFLYFAAVPIGNKTATQPPPNVCGSVVNNTLRSPGYPSIYPNSMDCVYVVPIPQGTTMNISFHDFDMEDDKWCSFDYLRITNDYNDNLGEYCGKKSGQTVLVTGDYAVLMFHSDSSFQRRGFLLFFTAVPQVPPRVLVPAAVVRSLPGYKVWCSATGSPPIHIALIRNFTVLVNTTGTVKISLYEEGNYTCAATSKYGNNISDFLVTFADCISQCSYWTDGLGGNSLLCLNLTSPELVTKCATTVTDKISMEYTANFSHPLAGIFSGFESLRWLSLRSNNIQKLPANIFDNLTKLQTLLLTSNAITFLPDGVFTRLTALWRLNFDSNAIAVLPYGVFATLTELVFLDISSNAISVLPDGVFTALTNLNELNLTSNNIENITADILGTLTQLRSLYLASNNIKNITADVLRPLSKLTTLDASSNRIQELSADLFSVHQDLQLVFLSSNNIPNLPAKLFFNTFRLRRLDLSYNRIISLPKGLFCCMWRLKYLFLQNNLITSISNETFSSRTRLRYLFLSVNRLETIPHRAFFNLDEVAIIMLSDNPIKAIEPEAFKLYGGSNLNIYLLRTKLKMLSLESFAGLHGLDSKLVIKNRTVGTLKNRSPAKNCTIYLNPLNSEAEALIVYGPESRENKSFISAIMASGFRRIRRHITDDIYFTFDTFLPCPVGTFSNTSSRGKDGCTPCPPGSILDGNKRFRVGNV